MERTLVLVKPDSIQRKLAGQVISVIEQKGLKISAIKMLRMTEELCRSHYSHLKDKPFFPGIVKFMTSTPIIAMVVTGKDSIEVMRKLAGVTNSRNAEPGTIRGTFGISVSSNLVHASDSKESAAKEIKTFFRDEEIFSYRLALDEVLYAEDERS